MMKQEKQALEEIRGWLRKGATIKAADPAGDILTRTRDGRWHGGLIITCPGAWIDEQRVVKRMERRLAKRDRRIAGMERRIARLERALADRTMDMERLSNNVGQEVMRAMCNVRLIPVRGISDEPMTLEGRRE